MRKSIILSVLLLFAGSMLSAQRSRALQDLQDCEWKTFKEFIRYSEENIPDTSIDVKFYHLDLEIAIDSPYIAGQVACHFEPLVSGLEQIWLSLNSSLHVDNISGNTNSFYQVGDSILINLDAAYGPGDELSVEISYHGVPVMAGGYKGLRYETHHGNEPIIATLSTPYLAHYWYPCKDGPSDKPDSVYVDISIPVKFVNGVEVMAVSNGLLENVIDNITEKTYQWRHRYPIVTYYVMVSISNFVQFSEDYVGIYGEEYPLDYYVFQQDLAGSIAGLEDLPQVLDVFSEKYGEYPFSDERYGMSQLGFYGAIENQTNTIQNNMLEGWFNVSIHELGHMWFGDMITCGNWHHGWLNEGFATYSEAVYVEAISGFDEYADYVETFEYFNGGTLYLENASDTFNIFQGIIYSKGAYVLHMLRGVLGNETFYDCLYSYATNPDLMYGQAVTEDFQAVCENVSGEELGYFFDQWVYDAYYPEYHFNFENNGDSLTFLLWQVQEQAGRRPLFEMPVDVKLFFTGGGDTTVRVWNDEIYQLFTLAVPQAVGMMQVDPDAWLLEKSFYHPEIPVGLDEDGINKSNILKIFPNPVGESAVIELDMDDIESADLRIYDLKGREVIAMHNLRSGLHSLDRNSLLAGVYFYVLQSTSGEALASGKLVFK